MQLTTLFLMVPVAFLVGCSTTTDDAHDGGLDDVGDRVDVVIPSESRAYRMGFQAFPYDTTEQASDSAWEVVYEHTDLVSVVLEGGIPWHELLEQTDLPASLDDQLSELEQRLSETDAPLYLAVDLLNSARTEIVGDVEGRPLPDGFSVTSANSHELREAYTRYCIALFDRFEPDYFSPVLEINRYWLNRPADWSPLTELYRDLRETLKAHRVETQVFPTWNLEILTGLGAAEGRDQYHEVRMFDPNIDRLALLIDPATELVDAATLTDDYIRQAQKYSTRDVVVVGVGYPSDAFQVGDTQLESSQGTQYNLLAMVLLRADTDDFEFVVWRFPIDISPYLESLCPNRLNDPGKWCDDADTFDAIRVHASGGLLTTTQYRRDAADLWDDFFARDLTTF